MVGKRHCVKMELDLNVLKRSADKACEMAFKDRHRIAGAINWGDLGCTLAERYQDHTGRIGFRVIIEEAAPDAHELQEYIAERLAEMGTPDVEIVTEW